MKKANFDVSHELDEFLMVEKPLTHSKRKANPDLEKMKPELRQLEEQCVYIASRLPVQCLTCVSHRFTVYDFSANKRMSYYPHNQPITTTNHNEDGEPATVLQSTTNTMFPTTTMVERSSAGSPIPDERAQPSMSLDIHDPRRSTSP